MRTSKSQISVIPLCRIVVFLLLFILMACMFWRNFVPDYALVSNDGPLVIQESDWIHLPGAFMGCWSDSNSLGVSSGAVISDFTQLFRWVFGAIGCEKFIAPADLWFIGVTVFFLFRRARTRVVVVRPGFHECRDL